MLVCEGAKEYLGVGGGEQVEGSESWLEGELSIEDYFQLVWLCALEKVWDQDAVVVIEEDPFAQQMERYLCRLNQRGKMTIDEVLAE